MNNKNIFDIDAIKEMFFYSVGYVWMGDMIDPSNAERRKLEDKDLSNVGFTLPLVSTEEYKVKRKNDDVKEQILDFCITNTQFKERKYEYKDNRPYCYEKTDYSKYWQDLLTKKYGAEYVKVLVESNNDTIDYLQNQNKSIEEQIQTLQSKMQELVTRKQENTLSIYELKNQNAALQPKEKEIEK